MHENLACRPRYYIGDTLIKVRKYEGVWLPVTWNYAVEFFDLMHGRMMLGTDLFWVIPLIIQFHGFHCAVRALSVIQAIKLAWLLLAKRGNEDTIAFLWRCTQTNISAPVLISRADIGVSRTDEKEDRNEIELPRFVPFKNRVPFVQRTIWQPAFKRQTYKVFMCVPAVQWVQTATEEFIKGGERIVKCIKFKPRPNKKRRSLQHCRKESKLSLVMTLWIQKQHVPETKDNRFWFHHCCSGLFRRERVQSWYDMKSPELCICWRTQETGWFVGGEAAQMFLTYFQYSPMERSWLEEGLVFARADLRSHQFGVCGQYSGTLLVQVHPGHGGDVINVIVIPASN